MQNAQPPPADVVTQVQGEGSPLARTGHEGAVLHGEVARGDSLGTQAVEEGDLGARGYAHCEGRWNQCSGLAWSLGHARHS